MTEHKAYVLGAISASDLKKGMYITNDGDTAIPVYATSDGTGTPELTIQPGQLIGQIVDFSTGPGGVVVYFTSDAITSASSIFDQIGNYLLQWTGAVVNAGSVNISDLQDITSGQIQQQNSAITTAAAQGVNLANSIKEAAGAAGDALGGATSSFLKAAWLPIAIWIGYEIIEHSGSKKR